MDRNAPQPPPRQGKEAAWDLVLRDVTGKYDRFLSISAMVRDQPMVRDQLMADMRNRDAMGTMKYGTRLQTHNGRNALVDAYQEALDKCVYLRLDLAERYDGVVEAIYSDAISSAAAILGVILEREAKGARREIALPSKPGA